MANKMARATVPSIHSDRAFFGHPRGLGFLAFTEGWVAFSLYGMQSLLVIYMVGYLLKPGHIEHVLGFNGFHTLLEHIYGPLSGQALASAIMGVYVAFIYATPLLGGLVADRLLGRTNTIILRDVLMTIGHFLMAFDSSFLIALTCLLAGTGCAGTMKAQVGGLYSPSDLRRADAFQVYVLAVQLAVIVAPLVCGTLGEKVGWPLGFGAAGVGMLIGLAVYLYGRRWMPPEPVVQGPTKAEHPPMTAREWRTVAVLVLLLPVIAVAFVGNNEIFNGYMLWGQANYQLNFFGQTMPISWLLSLDALISTATIGASIVFWRWWASKHREPDEIVKMSIGALIAAAAPLILSAASLYALGGHKVGLVWGVGFHLVNDFGFASLYPVGLALYSRAAPPALGATIVNGYSLSIFLSNLLVGWLAGLLTKMSGAAFWAMHAGLVGGAAVVLLACAALFHRTLAPQSEADR